MSADWISSLIRAARPFPWSDAPLGRQWALALAGWGVAAALSFTRFTLGPAAEGLEAVAARVPLWLVCYGSWAATTPALAWLVWRHPLDRSEGETPGARAASLARRLPAYLAVGGVATLAASFVAEWGSAVYLRWLGIDRSVSVTALDYFLESLVCAAAIGVLTAAARWHEARRREQEVARLTRVRLELENALRDAQLQALRMKVNPHFLFNALQTVTALVRTDPRGAERMLARVGDVLRMALRLDLSTEIPLKQELEVASAYLDLEQVRFQDRLRVALDVEPGLADALVPSLILQPLVENAIRHGVSRRSGEAELRVDARREGDALVLAVLDNGPGFEFGDGRAVREGVGLEVVRSRLEMLHPGGSACRLYNRPQGGAVVELRLPLRRADSRSGHAA